MTRSRDLANLADSTEFTSADNTKLDGIETSATADQTNAEIRSAVEAATDSNVFTDADHTKLNAIEASATADQTDAEIKTAVEAATNIALGGSPTTTTQAESDDSTKIATTAYVTDKITTLIGGAPSTLNDLNELAAAINDDANYNSTLTTALATKLPLAGGTVTGNVSFGDNNKAIFGTGSDLQIYHSGSHSLIEETGTGALKLKGEDIRLEDADGNNIIKATSTAAELYFSGAKKLETTEYGVAATGQLVATTTAHNAGSTLNSTGTTQLWLRDTDAATNQKNWGFQVSGGDLNIVRANDDRASGFVTPIYIQQAPANSLVINSSGHTMINTTVEGVAGAKELTVASTDSGNTGITIRAGTTSSSAIYMSDATSGAGEYAGYIAYSHSANAMNFGTSGTQKMTLDSSGKLRVGGSSSTMSNSLNVEGTGFTLMGLKRTSGVTTGTGELAVHMETNSQTTVSYDDEGSFVFGTASTPSTAAGFSEKVRIDSSGNIKTTGGGKLVTGLGSGFATDADITLGSANPAIFFHDTTGGAVNAAMSVNSGIITFSNNSTGGNLSDQTARMTIGRYGHVDIIDGDLRFASGHGISFAATGGPSSGTATSEILSDYEEGDHECTVTMGSGTCTLSSNYNKIKYTRVGRNVTIQGQIHVSSTSNPSGTMRVTLPYTMATTVNEGANVGGGVVRSYDGLVPTGGLYLWGVTVFNTGAFVTLEWVKHNSATVNHVPQANEYLIFSFSYTTT